MALALGALALVTPARADETGLRAHGDAAVEALVAQALAARPELERVLAEVRAARERVPQAQAWTDPTLQLGLQNDGFTSWGLGTMETSWLSVMASQTFPFPGKTGLRGAVVENEVRQRLLAAERVRLTTAADVRRAYLALELARERLALLGRLTGLWEKSAGVAQLRYETVEGAQVDVLRARLELARIAQRRRRLELEERLQVQTINRLRQRPLDEALATPRRLSELSFPSAPEDEAALADARARSPELLAARAGVERATSVEALARHEALPDLTVAAGVMVRGPLAPMWTVSVGVPVPVFSGPRQTHAIAEAGALAHAAGRDEASVEQSLALRTHQRLEAWRALAEVWAAYQHGLLAQAEASADSTLGQYRAGRVSFASVLEANAGAIADADAALEVLAEGWRLAIAQAEVSLADVGAASSPMGAAAMPGTGPTGFSRSGGVTAPGSTRAGAGSTGGM
jgi:outer membrane protein TolC